jgi:hypothetical protein
MNKKLLAWHFLRDDCTTGYARIPVKVGQVFTVEGPLVMCEHGLHASRRLIDALRYAPGGVIERVELSGNIIEREDKFAASRRTCLWMVDATATLHEFACRCAEDALALVEEPDPRSLEAIRVKRLWLAGKATDSELVAAKSAAKSAAAKSAAWAAAEAAEWAAAKAAAEAAEWAAAKAAAKAAEWAAARDATEVAARDAVRERQNRCLTAMVCALHQENSMGKGAANG